MRNNSLLIYRKRMRLGLAFKIIVFIYITSKFDLSLALLYSLNLLNGIGSLKIFSR